MLESKRFSLFWFSRVAFGMGNHMQITVVGWHLYDLARNAGASVEHAALLLGFMGLVKFSPLLIFSFVGGAVADRFEQRHVLMWSYLARGLVPASMLLATVLDPDNAIGWLFFLTFLSGCINSFLPAANATMLPRLVERHRRAKAIAGIAMGVQGGVVVGPALGGFLFAVSPQTAYLTCALTYVFSLAMVALIRVAPRMVDGARVSPKNMAAMVEGMKFIWGNKIMLGAVSLDFVVGLLGGAIILLPAIARDVLLLGPGELGMLRSSMAVGAALTAFTLWRNPLRGYLGRWMFGATIVYGLATVAFGFSGDFYIAIGCLVVLGAADMMSTVVRQTLMQLIPPDGVRGRAAAFVFTSHNGSIELGNFEAGVVARFFGPVNAVIIGGFAALMASGVWMYLFPDLRDRDKLDSDNEAKSA